jgi:tRNA threonylcarbamoyladenosine dehydratase
MQIHRGLSKIRLVDFDYVTLSSLNRHATAGLADVGTPKVKCLERALRDFSKWVVIDTRIEVWRKEDGGLLLEDADWVVGEFYESLVKQILIIPQDAIDNIGTKVDLLKYCHDKGIKVCHVQQVIRLPQNYRVQ